MEKVKVFLSDPQVLFREGIHFILSGEEDFEVIGETTSNEEALTHIEANPPHIAILSMARNGNLDGPEITRRIKRSLPSVSVILTMDKGDEESMFAAMMSGVSAYLTKDADPEYLLNIIRVVAQGSQPVVESLFLPGLAARTLVEFEDLDTLGDQLHSLMANLAPKEAEILSSIAEDNKPEQVMAKLNISEETLRRNLKAILNKLIANDQARTLIEAAQSNMIIHTSVKRGGASAEYVTKAEFDEFRDSLMDRLKTLIGDLTRHNK